MESFGSLGLEAIRSSLLAVFLYILPGWALLSWLWKGKPLSWGEKIGLASGISIALYPILFLWSFLVGLAPGPLFAWGPGILAIFALLWRYRKTLKQLPVWVVKLPTWRPRWNHMSHFILLVVIVLLLITRLAVVRDMTAPAWGDSVHHTFIVQLMVDNGGLFQSWEPYAPIHSFTYHFGFHSCVATWIWLTGLAAPQAMLVVGQVLNVLAILALYPLVARLSGNRWAGIAAMIFAGLVSPMPAFYVNWGRYTQLAGQVILPGALWIFDGWWKSGKRMQLRTLVLVFILLAGLALTHYSIATIVGVAAVSWALWGLWRQRRRLLEWFSRTLQFGVAGILAVLSVVPWVIIVKKGRIPVVFERMTVSAEKSFIKGDVSVWKNTDIYFSDLLWIFGLVALVLAIWKRPRLAIPVAVWCGFSYLVTNPYLLGMPAPGWITNFALVIALYFPISILLGWLIGALWKWLISYSGGRALVIASVFLMLGIGVRQQMGIIDPFFQMMEPTDRTVFEWIKTNVPKDAKFLVNGFLVFDESIVVGSDAGWWLPFYTLRANTVPPVLYTMEKLAPSIHRYSYRQIAMDVRDSNGDSASLRDVLCQGGITYIFLGERRGSVGYGFKELVPESWLKGNSDFKLIYQQGKAQVWHFDRSRCL